jgi:sn-glycerol 3-phosphate transport system substrate-binding protein
MSADVRRPPVGRTKRCVAALVVCLGLAACGSGESILNAGNETVTTPESPPPSSAGPAASTVPGETTVPASTVPAPSTTAAPLADLPPCPVGALDGATQPVEIVFWHGMTAASEEELIRLTDVYNASQSRVRVQLQNQGGYEQAINKYIVSSQGSRPDLVQMPEYMVQTMVDTESNVPVQACLNESGYDTSDFLPRAIGAYATEGVTWGMPFNISDPVLYYNKAMFAAAGLDPEVSPRSLEELQAFSQQIVDSGAASYGIALDTGSDSGGGWFIEQWFAQAGELYADNENGRSAPATRVLYDNQLGTDLLTYLQGLVASGLAANVGDNPNAQDTFLKMADQTSPAAMTIGTSAALGTILNVVDGGLIEGITSDDIGMGPMPGPGPGAQVGGASLWIVDGKGDETTAAVWDYITYLVSEDVQSQWSAATGYVPVRSGAVEVEPLAGKYAADPRFKVAYDQLLASAGGPAAYGPILGPLREVRSVTARAVATILGGGDPASSLADAAAQANALIADYAARNQ